MSVIAFDTSNYTTSCAWFDGDAGENHSRLLDVKPGELGLRQSEALFFHVKRLPELSDRLFARIDPHTITAVGVSTRPRAVEGSYMPCFLAGESQARVLAAALHVPVYSFSHQQGHIAAVLWSAGRMDLMDRPFLAWHLSGGTTELLSVSPDPDGFRCDKIGGTTDISAGQLIDRIGVRLSLPFPAGRHLDLLAGQSSVKDRFAVKVNDCAFSLSGMENKAARYAAEHTPADTARFVLQTVSLAVCRATAQALERFPGRAVVFTGGVASNSILRSRMGEWDAVFGEAKYSTDNAMGIAVLTHRKGGAHGAANCFGHPAEPVSEE